MDTWDWTDFIHLYTEEPICSDPNNAGSIIIHPSGEGFLDGRTLGTPIYSPPLSGLVLCSEQPLPCAGTTKSRPIIDTQYPGVHFKVDDSSPVDLPDSPQSHLSVSSKSTSGSKRKADAIALEESRLVSVKQIKNSPVGGAFMVFGKANPQRGRYDEGRRKEVAHNRKVGACRRCKDLKASCGRSANPYEMCKGCTSLRNPLSLRLPCFLETLTEAQLFRNKASVNHPLYFARVSVYDLRDSAFLPADMHNIRLAQGTGEELVVSIARYFPQEGDKTAYAWTTTGGTQMTVDLPPLCIVQLEEAKKHMIGYIQRSRNAYICSLPADNLTAMVLDEARRFADFNPNSTTRKALDLLAADRIIERDWLVSGDDPCDIPYVCDPDNFHYTRRPITPMMDCQLDQLVIQGFLQPLRKELLEQLQMNINTDRHERWYDIFLTTFVLLVNAEQLLAHSRRNAQRHGAQGRYNSPELATLYFHACKMFIAHFRFVCNFKGLMSIDWRSAEALAMAKLDGEQLGFLGKIKDKVQTNRQQMLDLRSNHAFERPSYWTHQIMFDEWNAGDPITEQYHINTAPLACA